MVSDVQDQESHQNFQTSNYRWVAPNVLKSPLLIFLCVHFSRQTSSSESQMSKDVEPLKNYMSTVTLSEIRSWDDSGTEARGETGKQNTFFLLHLFFLDLNV